MLNKMVHRNNHKVIIQYNVVIIKYIPHVTYLL